MCEGLGVDVGRTSPLPVLVCVGASENVDWVLTDANYIWGRRGLRMGWGVGMGVGLACAVALGGQI